MNKILLNGQQKAALVQAKAAYAKLQQTGKAIPDHKVKAPRCLLCQWQANVTERYPALPICKSCGEHYGYGGQGKNYKAAFFNAGYLSLQDVDCEGYFLKAYQEKYLASDWVHGWTSDVRDYFHPYQREIVGNPSQWCNRAIYVVAREELLVWLMDSPSADRSWAIYDEDAYIFEETPVPATFMGDKRQRTIIEASTIDAHIRMWVEEGYCPESACTPPLVSVREYFASINQWKEQ